MKGLKPASSISQLLSSFPSDKASCRQGPPLWDSPYCFSSIWKQCLAQRHRKVHLFFVLFVTFVFIFSTSICVLHKVCACHFLLLFKCPGKIVCLPLIKLHSREDHRVALKEAITDKEYSVQYLQFEIFCCCSLNFIQLLAKSGRKIFLCIC